MPTRKSVLALAMSIACTVSLAVSAQAQVLESRREVIAPRPLPPEMTRRFSTLQSRIQPSVKVWVEQQARLQAQKPAPDTGTIETAIRGRFPQLNSPGGSLANEDISSIVFLVMMQATQSADQDLQTVMNQVKAINQAKQQLRSLETELNAEVGRSAASPAVPCRSPFCRSLPARLGELSMSTGSLPHPVRLQSPAEPTGANLRALQNQLKSQLDSMNEMGETESMRLQMTMDRRSKLIETLSDVMKKMSDTGSTIVQNLK